MSIMSRGRENFQKFKGIILLAVKWYRLFPRKIRYYKLERNRYTRGYRGQMKRYALVKSIAKHVGDNVGIKEGVFFRNIDNLSIGNNVSIWPLTYIDAYGGLAIGDNVSIAHGVSILAFEHQYAEHEIPIKDQGLEALPVSIGDNVWIGAKATILGGICVESGSVIGAGTVITKNIPHDSVVVGVPGKKIKNR